MGYFWAPPLYGHLRNEYPLLLPGTTKLAKADSTFVRTDGLRIAMEITQGTSHINITEKLNRWISLLENKDIDTRGLIVCIVNASVDRPNEMASTIKSDIEW